ncbi:MAG: hypothetical protein KJ060_21270 [Candidatus Hydrogenedentes bacterium]|nr:hypothetical protein [Candidatus Hydrogenedentota bacterium]
MAVFEFTLDEVFVLQMHRTWLRCRKARPYERTLKIALAVPITVLMILGAIGRIGVVFFPMLIVLALLVFAPQLDQLLMRRRLRKSPGLNDRYRIEISDSGLRATGPKSESTVAWAAFTAARRVQDGILLYQGPNVFNWLPSDALVEGTLEDAEVIIRRNISDYLGVRSKR